MIYIIVFWYLFIFFQCIDGLARQELCSDVVTRRPYASRNSHMFLLKSKETQWLIKQRKGAYVDSQLTPVLETLGTSMAERIGIICNHVRLVPINACKKYKRAKNRPATLHSLVPGVSPRATKHMASLNIHQTMERPCGKKCGFTRPVISGMALHASLPAIVALDTFIGNSDRSSVNLLYDPNTDNFYAIDFGFSFKSNLAKGALATLIALDGSRAVLSLSEVQALTKYRDTLQTLLTVYRPETMIAQFRVLVKQAGLFSKSASFAEGKKKLKQTLALHERFMHDTHHSTTKLVRYLNEALPRFQGRIQPEPQ